MFLLAATLTPQESFWNQPIDIILNQLLVSFGWIPIGIVLFWGFIKMWQNYRQGIYVSGLNWVILAIDVPPTTEQTPKALENLFTNIYGSYSDLTWKEKWIVGKVQPLFCFEIASTEGYIQFYVRCLTRFRDVVEAGIYAQYPEAEISEVEDYTTWAPSHFPNDEYELWGSELKLKKDWIFPIRTYLDFEDKMTGEIKDPLGQVLEGMAKMKPGEHYWIQIILQPNGNDWKKAGEKFINKTFGVEEKHKPGAIESGLGAVLTLPSMVLEQATGVSLTDSLLGGHHEPNQGDIWKAFKLTAVEREQADGVLRKTGKIGHKVKVRMVYIAKKGVYDKNARTAFVKGMYSQYTHLNLNAFGLHGPATPKDDYFWQRWEYTGKQERLVKAYRTRSWGIGAEPYWLNVEELATLWHFPTISSKAPLVKRAEARRAEPPVGLPITLEDRDLPSGPPKPYTTVLAEPPAAHGGDHGHGGGQHAAPEAHAAPAHHMAPPPAAAPEVPELHLPADVAAGERAQRTVSPVPDADPMPEREMGLDATDMGPPADVQLPGPPPGWKPPENEGDEGEVPPNLPM